MFRAWMTHEHWLTWIAAAIVFVLALAAIGYLAGWWDKPPVSAALWRWLRSTA